MKKKVALVTAATKGLGRAVAEALHQQDYDLALMGRSDEILELASSLGALGVKADITKSEDIKRFVREAQSNFGKIDVVVNNTGHAPGGTLLELTDDQWDAGYEILLKNVIRMTRECAPLMSKGGVFVNISSFGAKEPSAKFPVSSVIRAGLSAYTKLFANEYGNSGIRMVNVLPGYFETYSIDEETVESIPLGRSGKLNEIAQTVAFLASQGAGYITGTDILVDGGIVKSN